MPDRGTWTLRCQNCRRDFVIVVNPGERLIDFARDYPCPHCNKKPDDPRSPLLGSWHHV